MSGADGFRADFVEAEPPGSAGASEAAESSEAAEQPGVPAPPGSPKSPEVPVPPEVPEPPGRPRDGRRMRAFRGLSDRTPLRTKLIAAVLVLVVIALAAISVASDVVLRSYLTTQQDSTLKDDFAIVLHQAEEGKGFTVGAAYATAQQGIYLEFLQPGLQFASPSSTGNVFPGMGSLSELQSLPALPTNRSWPGSASTVLQTVPAQSGGSQWRVIAQTVSLPVSNGTGSPSQTENLTLVVATDLGNINGTINRLVTVEVIVGAAIMVVLLAVGIGLVRANLRPLDDIEMTAGQIARGHLNHRIPERDPRTEIGSLGRSLNTMLSQIETAFHAQEASEQAAHESEERMRRFIADASHELRTPLTTIRGFAEYYRQRGGPPRNAPGGSTSGHLAAEDVDRLMQRMESEASRMGLLVEDLLQLARLDQQRPLDLAPVDLLTLALDAVQDARIVAPERAIDLSVAPGAAFIVNGDEARLRQVIGNLVTNARTHTPPGTPIRVKIASGTLDSGGPAVVLDVEDDGPGMTAEQAQRVFERFYRADAARNRASGGTGLGLAIVAGLVAAHGGTVAVHTAPGGGADFQVKLPLSPDAQGIDEED
jgi:two-component system OmpR family sensor kinase